MLQLFCVNTLPKRQFQIRQNTPKETKKCCHMIEDFKTSLMSYDVLQLSLHKASTKEDSTDSGQKLVKISDNFLQITHELGGSRQHSMRSVKTLPPQRKIELTRKNNE